MIKKYLIKTKNRILWLALFTAILISACNISKPPTPDTTPPALTISTNSTLLKDTPGSIVFSFTENITGFTTNKIELSDVDVDKEEFITISKQEYIWKITPKKIGTLNIVIPASSFKDLAGNFNTKGISNKFSVIDTTPPTLSKITIDSPLEKNTLREISFYFNEEVTNFTTSVIDLSGFNLDEEEFITNSKQEYTWKITPKKVGTLNVVIPASSFKDLSGNSNATSFSTNFEVIDTTPPTLSKITIDSPLEKNTLREISFYFNEEVNGFTTSVIDLSGFNLDEEEFITNSKQEYTWKITPKKVGTLNVVIPASSFKDLSGNSNATSFSTNFEAIDTTPPTLSKITIDSPLEKNTLREISFYFNEEVNGFTTSVIDLSGFNLDEEEFITNSKQEYTWKITPKKVGTLNINIKSNSLQDISGNPLAAFSTNFFVDIPSEKKYSLEDVVNLGRIPSENRLNEFSKNILSHYTSVSSPAVVARYVKVDGTGDGSSWDNADSNPKETIGEITDASANRVYLVLVASGEYPSTNIVMKNHIAFVGGWNPDVDWERAGVTRFDGQGRNRVFYNDNNNLDSTALLYHATITKGNTDNGGGMYNNNSSPSLGNVTFSENNASENGGGMYNNTNASPSLKNVIFSENTANYGGGIGNAENSEPTLNRVYFSNNIATIYGGGIYNDNSFPNLEIVTFSENTANKNGGGMYNTNASPSLKNVTFSKNTATENGGGIGNFDSSSPNLEIVTFSENTANKNGGGMYNTNASPSLKNVTFSKNTATENGGGMGNFDRSSPNLEIVTFSENTASENGGGMHNTNASPSLKNVTFLKNTATENGGGMGNFDRSSPNLEIVTFSENTANYGGGMHNTNASPSLKNVTFSKNTATENGGGMGNFDNSSPNLEIVTFSENTASKNGGGMYNNTNASPSLKNVTFSKNTATENGGGMGNFDNSSPNLKNVTFSKNTATENGGGIGNFDNSSPNLKNVTFSENTANENGGGMGNFDNSSPNLENVIFSGNTASKNGGGMVNAENSKPTLNGIYFSNNIATTYGGGMYNDNLSLNLVTFILSGNEANHGGGMYNNTNTSPSLENVIFSGNKTHNGDGGGMFNNNSSPSLKTVTFSGNKTHNGDGGGMFNNNSSPSLKTVTFSGNKTHNGDGGGMFNNNSSPSLKTVTFSGNTSEKEGGGMFNDNASPSLENVTFSGNETANNGGGMFNSRQSSPILVNVTFSRNKTHNGDGGGMFNTNAVPSLENVTFSGNEAANNGGGMFNGQSSPILVNVTFSENRAISFNGGGILNNNSSPKLVNVTFSENNANDRGGGMFVENTLGSGPLLVNTIFWGNLVTGNNSDYNQIWFRNPSDDNIGLHYSIIEDGTRSLGRTLTSSRTTDGDPLLSSLADNGGLVKTHALGNNSPAINKGVYVRKYGNALYFSENENDWYTGFDKNGLSKRATIKLLNIQNINITDARGYKRTGLPDIGAYEYGGTPSAD